jgi:hypothetical protein
MIFNNHENNFNSNQLSELQRFIILAARFKMQNLIRNLQAKYPSLFIDNYEVILNRNTITKVEPNNILLDIFNEKTKINNNCYYHYRNADIFKKYLVKYILNIDSLDYTANNIMKLKNIKSESNKQLDQYAYNKILDDLKYYRFDKSY